MLLDLFPTSKWRWWCLSLFKSYAPNQQKQLGCSHVFLIWPMNSLLIPNFGFLLANNHSFFRNDLQFKLFGRTAHSILTSSPPNIQSMSTAKQDTIDSRWADQSETLWTYNRIQQQRGGRNDFPNNSGTQNSNICPTFQLRQTAASDYFLLISLCSFHSSKMSMTKTCHNAK